MARKRTTKKSSLPITKVDIPEKVLIAGRFWHLKPATEKVLEEFQAVLDEDVAPGDRKLRLMDAAGAAFPWLKTIVFKGIQHKEELLDTLLHEGIHAILAEYSENPMYANLCQDEQFVDTMTREILNYLKQIGMIELRCKPQEKAK